MGYHVIGIGIFSGRKREALLDDDWVMIPQEDKTVEMTLDLFEIGGPFVCSEDESVLPPANAALASDLHTAYTQAEADGKQVVVKVRKCFLWKEVIGFYI